jgi:hypothetical protein
MAQEQTVRVVVERKRSGCGTVLLVMILLGLAIEYWYISLALLAIVIAIAMLRAARERELARHRPGPRDAWLNQVAVALADLGLAETERNTGERLGGVPIDGDIGLQAERLKVYVTLFSSHRRAREAELGLRAKPEIRDAVSRGATALRTAGRVLYVANGRGKVLDEFRFDEVVRVVSQLAVPPPLPAPASIIQPNSRLPAAGHASPPAAQADQESAEVPERLRKLAQLRDAGVLTDEEFAAKKAELLDRF